MTEAGRCVEWAIASSAITAQRRRQPAQPGPPPGKVRTDVPETKAQKAKDQREKLKKLRNPDTTNK